PVPIQVAVPLTVSCRRSNTLGPAPEMLRAAAGPIVVEPVSPMVVDKNPLVVQVIVPVTKTSPIPERMPPLSITVGMVRLFRTKLAVPLLIVSMLPTLDTVPEKLTRAPLTVVLLWGPVRL